MADLPSPVTVTDMYLAAILVELRAIRAQREPETPPDTVDLREPAKPKRKRTTKRSTKS